MPSRDPSPLTGSSGSPSLDPATSDATPTISQIGATMAVVPKTNVLAKGLSEEVESSPTEIDSLLSNPTGWTEDRNSLTEFTIFMDLAPELRLKIWEHAMDEVDERVVEILWSEKHHRFFTNCPVPTVLQACRESRTTLKYDRIVVPYGKSSSHLGSEGLNQAEKLAFTTWVDLSRDILYFCLTGHRGRDSYNDVSSAFLKTLMHHYREDWTKRKVGLQRIAFEAFTLDTLSISDGLTDYDYLKEINVVNFSIAPSVPLSTLSADPTGWTPKTIAPTTLHDFAKLPIELRLEIFKHALVDAESRIVEVLFNAPILHFHTTCVAPALLHASSESRREAKKHYDQLVLQDGRPGLSDPKFSYTWIDYSQDILYFCPTGLITSRYGSRHIKSFLKSLSSASNGHKLLRVAFEATSINSSVVAEILTSFPLLKDIKLVYSDVCVYSRHATKEYKKIQRKPIIGCSNIPDDTKFVRWNGYKKSSVDGNRWNDFQVKKGFFLKTTFVKSNLRLEEFQEWLSAPSTSIGWKEGKDLKRSRGV
ncbi:uncharacterized protein LY89DRAFT_727192 [Mollisia scopiformis]|uniref:2EXR domain-containing protein n=1 Tax=Mollisia scopiformis TaxID=149040 RepID=A0A194XWQ2_MOLSC|nr:uncharacterized protein LY89DRAFT_727192 [Mollisia scopiformis]KUJ24157.1 hypothetical protein LY89DRAFT_727192 [Mollisia scopiformis]